jgi:hypothetical protein
MIRILLVTALFLSPIYSAVAQPHCISVSLYLGGSSTPNPLASARVAELDMQGRWVVSSWASITWYVTHSGLDPLATCIATHLMDAHSSVTKNIKADTTCPSETHPLNMMWAQRISAEDPIIHACQPVICHVGDNCS